MVVLSKQFLIIYRFKYTQTYNIIEKFLLSLMKNAIILINYFQFFKKFFFFNFIVLKIKKKKIEKHISNYFILKVESKRE